EPSAPIWLCGDLTRLAQVVSNLLNNAAKYTPEGGNIELSVASDDTEVVIRVVDDGVGISREVLPELFQLFAQVNRTRDRAQGGLGIGLSLVMNLVQMHGGKVDATSEGLGRGATFTVRLPILVEDAPEARAISPRRGPTGDAELASRRILVVDDNIDG